MHCGTLQVYGSSCCYASFQEYLHFDSKCNVSYMKSVKYYEVKVTASLFWPSV